MDCLYHYCPTEKCFSILSNRNLRMSDIGKSNDYMELQLLFPRLHQKIWELYEKDPFPFHYDEYTDRLAFRELLELSAYMCQKAFESGDYSNYVVCFSETQDSLSQWRGYANDGKGCCLGFSKDVLQKFCDATNGILRLEPVEYITEEDLDTLTEENALEILAKLRSLRSWIVENMTYNDNNEDTDGLLMFNFNSMLRNCFAESLKYKKKAFSEEYEWRIFLANKAYKNPEWIYSESSEELKGPKLFSETIGFLRDRTDFLWSDNDLVSYCVLSFKEFVEIPVKELWIGPKNWALDGDTQLFLKKYGYNNVEIHHSNITYR